jgi:adenosylhomocysteine nucleosidase
MTDRTEVVIVAALEREIAPLVRGWSVILGPRYHYYERGAVIVVCGGIGPEAARQAADTVLTFRQPSVIISAGFAGALRESVSVGSLVVPTKVLTTEGGRAFRIDGGKGTLVSTGSIVSLAVKRELAKTYTADAVDMEAASVAEVAQAKGVRFVAVKAISDGSDFDLPQVDRFVDGRGEFQTLRFALHALVRPAMWPAVGKLKRNADRAAAALCEFLAPITGAGELDSILRGTRAG